MVNLDYRLIRAERGIAPEDSYSLDHYLSIIIAQGLQDIEDFSGHPYGIEREQWKKTLKKIRKGFIIYTNPRDYSTEQRVKAVRKSLKLLRKWYPALWY